MPKAISKNFSLTYDELRFIVGDVVDYMNRDSTEFAVRGVTQTNIDDFETLGDEFETFPSDSIYQGQIKIEVESKDTARNSCTLQIRTISGYFQQKWGIKSGQYRMLDIKNFNTSRDTSFITIARNVASMASTYLSDLSGIGLTQTQIDDLSDEAQTMEDKYHAIRSKTALRDEKTQERVQKANELYEELVKYCEIGKLIWENTNEAKYNDYIIYEKVNHGLSKVQGFKVEPNEITPTDAELSWSPVAGAIEYEVYQSQVAHGDSPGEYSKINTVVTTSDLQSMTPGFRYYFKVRGINATQIGAFSNQEWIEA